MIVARRENDLKTTQSAQKEASKETLRKNVYITNFECSLSKSGADSQKNKYIPENIVVMACIGANAGEVALTSYLAQTN